MGNQDGDKENGVVFLNMEKVESSTTHYDTYFTEYEISLMPENEKGQVRLYDQESDTSWSRSNKRYSTVRPAERGRGQLGEGRTKVKNGKKGSENELWNEGKQKEDHSPKLTQRQNGLLINSGDNVTGSGWFLIIVFELFLRKWV